MKEILGGNLDKVFEELNIAAIKTYQENTPLSKTTQIWEVEQEDFEKLCNIETNDWQDDWGWWRSADGSNVKNPLETFKIKGQEIKAWDGDNRLDDEDGNYSSDRGYNDLLEYLSEEIGASQPRNVCALAIDLAKINNIKLSELFRKYQNKETRKYGVTSLADDLCSQSE